MTNRSAPGITASEFPKLTMAMIHKINPAIPIASATGTKNENPKPKFLGKKNAAATGTKYIEGKRIFNQEEYLLGNAGLLLFDMMTK